MSFEQKPDTDAERGWLARYPDANTHHVATPLYVAATTDLNARVCEMSAGFSCDRNPFFRKRGTLPCVHDATEFEKDLTVRGDAAVQDGYASPCRSAMAREARGVVFLHHHDSVVVTKKELSGDGRRERQSQVCTTDPICGTRRTCQAKAAMTRSAADRAQS